MPDGRLDVTASYDDLLRRGDAPPGSTWGLFDPTSERGMADLAGPEQVLAASSLVRTGEVVNLDHSLAAFDPPMARARQAPRHTIVAGHPQSRDDSLDFFLQASSQVDGLRHRRAQDWGFYDGHADAQIAVGSPTLGVQRWAERPVVGRGVLLDVAAARAGLGAPLDHARGEVLEVRRRRAGRPRARAHRLGVVVPRPGPRGAHRGPRPSLRHGLRAAPRTPQVALGPPGRPVRH
nr:hypothetical protein [Aeromicrobium sp. REDSEA-S32_B7]